MIPSNRITVRVCGDYACFARPEMKVQRVSDPIMTPSAARGVLEANFWEPQMYYVIGSIAVVKKGRCFSIRRNEVKKVVSRGIGFQPANVRKKRGVRVEVYAMASSLGASAW